jgi:general secretion pathway protein D
MVILPGQTRRTNRGDGQSEFVPPSSAGTNDPNDISMNFRNAPLEMVLNYLSDASDFAIVLDTRVNGNVSVTGNHMTRDMVVDLLNGVLNKNGYAAIRNDRILTIVDKNEAKTRDIPVKTGNDYKKIPRNAEIVTQIIPIRFVEARQLVSDLTSFVSPQATVMANEAGNSIVITDTQQNIRHLIEIIQAIDDSAQSETEIRVFTLKNANPTEVAQTLMSVFPSSSSGGAQSPISFGGNAGGGRGGRGGGGGANPFAAMFGGGGGSSSNDRIKKATQVTAVADARTQSVVVTAPKDMMDKIAGMMEELDVPSGRDQDVTVFHLDNADPQQAMQVLQTMFQTTGNRNSGTTQNSPLMQRKQNATTQTTGSSSSSSRTGGTTGGGRTGGGGF